MSEIVKDQDRMDESDFLNNTINAQSARPVSPIQIDPIENQRKDFEKDCAIVTEDTEAKLQEAILPNFQRHRTKPGTALPTPIIATPKRKGFDLASLLQNNVKSATFERPIDPNSLKGQRDLLAKQDRELKFQAKQECLDRFSGVDLPGIL